jgi:RND family efflux transporter MFP subunit
MVGQGTPTKLATIVQLDPIWVNFTISEQDILRIRQELIQQGIHSFRLDQVMVEIGLQSEDGYPHAGRLDYISPIVDPGTGTQALRAVFTNPDHLLLPGFFVRLRLRTGRPAEALLVPETAVGADQSGRYVLVVGAGEVVEQRSVRLGSQVGAFQVVESGLAAEDRVVVNGLQRATPGARVAPRPTTLTPPPSAPAAAEASAAPAAAPTPAAAPAAR